MKVETPEAQLRRLDSLPEESRRPQRNGTVFDSTENPHPKQKVAFITPSITKECNAAEAGRLLREIEGCSRPRKRS
ncbi:hypothetical protein M1I95_01415 [Rossellomorea marisflavi]|uniref:hypothetical protein n=1 Tax=Rossellomorea marisflavi TaxID=189381 RepID=UPI002798874E|nr:hypothetical protein [Rossellomorea marisflavi]UTE73235.1 hypothetical protein M1I95_01415 [Rossellomorea marisflavi]